MKPEQRFKRYCVELEFTVDLEREDVPEDWNYYVLLGFEAPDPNLNVRLCEEVDSSQWMIFNANENDGFWNDSINDWTFDLNEATVYHTQDGVTLPPDGVWYPLA